MLRPWKLNMDIGRAGDKAVYVQIVEAITDAIKSGKLKSGDTLPGSRRLAGQLKVNRNTVVEALEVLISEGWLISVERKGTFVSEKIPRSTIPLSESTQKIIRLPVLFDDGAPDARLSPVKELSRIYRQLLSANVRKCPVRDDGPELGDIGFREATARMLNYSKGMQVRPSQICITRGSQMALYLAAQCLIQKGDVVVVENPGYKGAWKVFAHSGATLLPVSVDKEGLNVDELELVLRKTPGVKAVYVTPYHQFPTTVTLSAGRRRRLIQLSNEFGFTIIEDDYDSEFHFQEEPVFPVSSFADAYNYIYIGTLGKMISPALRIGFLISYEDFIVKAGNLRKLVDVQGDAMMEKAVLEMIRSGELRKHIRKAIAVYKAKRDFFEGLLQYYLREKIEFTKPKGGLAFWVKPQEGIDLYALNEGLLKKGVIINTPDRYSFKEDIHGLRMGFASLSESQLEEGVISISELV